VIAKKDLPCIGVIKTGQELQERRLAAAAGAQEKKKLPICNFQRDVIDRRGFAEKFTYLIESNPHICICDLWVKLA
jgi:hypothetical protein